MCRVFQHGDALGQRGGHQQVFGTGHGHHVGSDVRPAQARAANGEIGNHVAVLNDDLGPHRLQALDVLVHRARANAAATGQRDPRLTEPGQQRPQHQHRGPHGADQIVGRNQRRHVRGMHIDLSPAALRRRHAHAAQQSQHGRDITQAWHVAQLHRLGGQQASTQRGQSGIFGTRDRDLTVQAATAANQKFVHGQSVQVSSRSIRNQFEVWAAHSLGVKVFMDKACTSSVCMRWPRVA